MARPTKEHQKERLAEAVRLRIARFTYAAIAERCGYYDAIGAKRALDKYYKDMIQDTADVAVARELETLDQMQRGLYNDYIAGDTKAIQATLKIMDHRAKLLRLYPKEEVEQDAAVKIIIDARLLPVQAQQAVALGELENIERPSDG